MISSEYECSVYCHLFLNDPHESISKFTAPTYEEARQEMDNVIDETKYEYPYCEIEDRLVILSGDTNE